MSQLHEPTWLNELACCSLDELAQASGLSPFELCALVERGVINALPANGGADVFQLHCIVVARTARRLRDDFELNLEGMALALNLLRRIEALEQEIKQRGSN